MRVAYLVNQYPKTSHSFIRREIHALERQGVTVERFSIREIDEIVDAADQLEQAKTQTLLDRGGLMLLVEAAAEAIVQPIGALRGLAFGMRLGWRGDRGMLRHVAYWMEALALKRRLKRRGVTHLHAHFGTNSAAVAAICHIAGGPSYSFTVHGPEEFDRPIALKLRMKARHAAFVVAISSYGRSQLMRWLDMQDWRKIRIVRCGVEPDLLGDSISPFTSRTFVCVGRLCEQKGQILLVRAIAKLHQQGFICRLVLVGDGPMRSAIRQEIASCGLHDHIELCGWQDEAGVKSAILEARALVLPSFAEGLPVVLMEALALGRPVITTYIAGIPELVRSGENGWLVPAGDVDALAGVMKTALLADEQELAALGEAGRQTVSRLHDVQREAARLRSLIECACAASPDAVAISVTSAPVQT